MPYLTGKARAQLPDSAFAYIDSAGRRRLPINDATHLRNALARFNQTLFEDEAARDKARTRLLKAAQKYGIVPIGFMSGQLRSGGRPKLPAGTVTLLLADVEDSTGLVRKLGNRYGSFLGELRTLLRGAVQAARGAEVDARADEFFAVFKQHSAAVQSAVSIQREVATRAWPDGLECRLRIGLHTGAPEATDHGYVGLAVNTAARVCAIANGGQILVSSATWEAVTRSTPPGIGFKPLGEHRLRGLPEPEPLYQLLAEGLPADLAPLQAG